MWFDNNLIKNEQSRANAIPVLQRDFAAENDHCDYAVCCTCEDSFVAGKLPDYRYRYPPKPEHLPELNPVKDREPSNGRTVNSDEENKRFAL